MQFIKTLFSKINQTFETKSTPYSPYMSMAMGYGIAQWTGCGYHNICSKGYRINPIMHSCIRMIADGASRVPIIAKNGNKSLVNHDILRLLKSPSSDVNGRIFRMSIFSNLLISGNCFIDFAYDNNKNLIQSLFLLRPDRVQCVLDKQGNVIAYEYGTGKTKKRYEAKRILHLKYFAPDDDHYGCAPSQAAWRAIELHNEATIFQKALLDNAARPSGCLIYSGLPGAPNLTESQFQRLKSELQDHYTGAAATGRPMILEGGLEWKSMSISPQDMGIHTLRYDAAREIALAYGVPPMLLGLPGDNTYSNYQEATRAFTRQTIIPMAEMFYDAFADKMSKIYDQDLELVIDRKQISELFSDYFN